MRAMRICPIDAEQNFTVNYLFNSGYLSWVLCAYLLRVYGLFTVPLLSEPGALRFEPALDISQKDIQLFFQALADLCLLVSHGRFDHLLAYYAGVERACLSDITRPFPISSSGPYQSTSPPVDDRACKTFAFILHAISPEDVAQSLPLAVRTCYRPEQLKRLAKFFLKVGRLDPFPAVVLRFKVRSHKSTAWGVLIYTPLLAEDLLKLPVRQKNRLQEQWLELANNEGAEVVGLGGYSSVISRGGTTIKEQEQAQGLVLTTGSSLTALSTTQGILQAESHNLTGVKIAVAGARGAVGKLIVADLSRWCGKLILIGRPGTEASFRQDVLSYLCLQVLYGFEACTHDSVVARLTGWMAASSGDVSPDQGEDSYQDHARDLARKILQQQALVELGIEFSTQVQSGLVVDYLISATSEGKAFLDTGLLGAGATIIDVARPSDLVNSDGHVRVLEGGLVIQPERVIYGDRNITGTPAGVNLACLSETIALTLEGCSGHYSLGKSIRYHHAVRVQKIAQRHGFYPVSVPARS